MVGLKTTVMLQEECPDSVEPQPLEVIWYWPGLVPARETAMEPTEELVSLVRVKVFAALC